MRRVIALLLCLSSATLIGQYQSVFLDSSGHLSKVFNATPAPYPDLSGFTWVNANGATLTQSLMRPPVIWFPDVNDNSEHALLTPLKSPPYTVTACYTTTQVNYSQESSATLFLYDSVSGKALAFPVEWEAFGSSFFLVAAARLPAITNVFSNQITLFFQAVPQSNRTCLQIVDNTTNRTLSYSVDDQRTWMQMFQEASGTYFTANMAGVSGYSDPATHTGFAVTVWYFNIQ